MMRHARGFSLLELLAVLAISGILASIAYPSYAEHLARARRMEGKLALFEMMQQQEALYSRSNTYAEFSAGGAPREGFRWWSGTVAADSAYELQARPCEGASLAQCVELLAMPGTQRVNARFSDARCETLSLRSTGEQGASGAGKDCWP
jgi:type IV pilus assembly protein PilE